MIAFSKRTVLAATTIVAACGSAVPAERAEEVRSAITAAIRERGDTLTLADPRTGAPVLLTFDYVHDGVVATPGGRYTACVDYRDARGTAYDVDYYVGGGTTGVGVEDVVMHRVGEEDVLAAAERERLDGVPD